MRICGFVILVLFSLVGCQPTIVSISRTPADNSRVVNPIVSIEQAPSTSDKWVILATSDLGAGYSYQWQQSVDGGTTYQTVSDAINPQWNLDLTQIVGTSPLSQIKARVIVSRISGGSATTSSPVALTLPQVISNSEQPSAQTSEVGGSVTFNTIASIASGTLSYQWQTGLEGEFEDVEGATDSSLVLNGVLESQNGRLYRVIIRASGGATSILSASAVLTVVAPTNNTEVCSDGIDNDADGSIDCADPDCNGQVGTYGGLCGIEHNMFGWCVDDLIDNDGDGFVDCADPDCYGLYSNDTLTSRCDSGSESNCSDNLDLDGDGLADEADPDCVSCSDADGDGYGQNCGIGTDCDDSNVDLNTNCNFTGQAASGTIYRNGTACSPYSGLYRSLSDTFFTCADGLTYQYLASTLTLADGYMGGSGCWSQGQYVNDFYRPSDGYPLNYCAGNWAWGTLNCSGMSSEGTGFCTNGDSPGQTAYFENGYSVTGVREKVCYAGSNGDTHELDSEGNGYCSATGKYYVSGRLAQISDGPMSDGKYYSNGQIAEGKIDESGVLLMHMDGENGSTTFLDSSVAAHSIITNLNGGNPVISTAQSKFGGASAYFNGGYLTISSDDDFGLGTDDFTIEMWARPDSGSGQYNTLINLNTYETGVLLRGTSGDGLFLTCDDPSCSKRWDPSTNMPSDTWTHLALVREAGVVRLYANGTSVLLTTYPDGTPSEFSWNRNVDLNSAASVMIGASAHNTGEIFVGYIDEVRISKGVARYSANFTPSNTAFKDLWFINGQLAQPSDGPQGNPARCYSNGQDSGAIDSSGNGYCGSTYYIGGEATTLDQNGTGYLAGSDNNLTVGYHCGAIDDAVLERTFSQESLNTCAAHCRTISGATCASYYTPNNRCECSSIPSQYVGWGDMYAKNLGTYYVNGMATTLDSSGTGTWNNQTYTSGSLKSVITINTQPSNQSASSGSASFSVSASVTNSATLSYQWQKQDGGTGSFSNVSNVSGVSGATSATLSLSSLTNAADDGDVYRVVVSATGGADDVNSSGATLTVAAESGGASSSGELFGWGDNGYYQLGFADQSPQKTEPTQIGADTDWDEVSAGERHTLALRNGALYAWGYNFSGQVGDGTQNTVSSPKQIGTDTDWTHISAGYYHSLGIRGGKLYAWGHNLEGKLGDGTFTDRHAPVQIGTDTDWTAIAAGKLHSLGIRGGKLYAWGQNLSGQLGNGDYLNQPNTPSQIGTETGWTHVSAKDVHSLAILNGALFAWGDNTYKQIYDSVMNRQDFPIQIGTDNDWSAVSAGTGYNLAIRGGKLYAWGKNFSGILGDGTEVDRSSPVQIGSSTLWTHIAAGATASLGIQEGKLYAWGYNAAYQLGDGTTTASLAPKQIGTRTDWVRITAHGDQGLGIRNSNSSCVATLETCDGTDNDCDGITDENTDVNGCSCGETTDACGVCGGDGSSCTGGTDCTDSTDTWCVMRTEEYQTIYYESRAGVDPCIELCGSPMQGGYCSCWQDCPAGLIGGCAWAVTSGECSSPGCWGYVGDCYNASGTLLKSAVTADHCPAGTSNFQFTSGSRKIAGIESEQACNEIAWANGPYFSWGSGTITQGTSSCSGGSGSTPVITINTQPSNQTASSGSASFSVSASVTQSATLSYQWQKQESGSGSFSNVSNGSGVSGATSATLSLSSLTNASDNGDVYRVVVSATGGATSVNSTSATLTVNQCASDGWCADESTYYIGGISCPTLTSGGTGYCSGTGYYYLSGAQTTLNSSGTGTWNNQTYTSGALKSVITINTQPSNQSASSGSASFSVSASVTNSATLSYQWQKQDGGTGSFSNVSGATSAALNLSSLTNAADNGDVYRVAVSATGGADDVNSSGATLTVAAEGGSGDTNFSDVALLLHLDGNTTDSSSSPRTVSLVNSGIWGSFSSDVKKFGTHSAHLDFSLSDYTSGGGTYLSVSNPSNEIPGQYTVETWFRTDTWSGMDSNKMLYHHCDANCFDSLASLFYQPSSNRLYFWLQSTDPSNSKAYSVSFYADVSITTSSWHHVALVRNGSVFSIYLDGNRAATGTAHYDDPMSGIYGQEATGTIPMGGYSNGPSTMYFGTGFYSGTYGDPFPGYLDEIRITNAARYSGTTYTVPSDAFSDSASSTPVITINTQPSNQTASSGSASFSVSASVTNSATLSYQWQKQESGIGSFSNVSNGSGVSGATSATLSLSSLTNAADNGDVYRVVVSATGGAGDVNSSSVTLTVNSAGGGSDPSFSDVTLLLHLDGTATDSSSLANSVTVVSPGSGAATFSSGDKKFGTQSISFSGTSVPIDEMYVNYGKITTDLSSTMTDVPSQWTLEMWFKPNEAWGAGTSNKMLAELISSSGSSNMSLYYANGKLVFYSAEMSWWLLIERAVTISSAWHHVALVRDGGNVSLYLDGNRLGASGSYTDFTGGAGNPNTSYDFVTLNLGASSDMYGDSFGWSGYLDEVRMSNLSRYSGTTYTVPSDAFSDSASSTPVITINTQPSNQTASSGSASFSVSASVTNSATLSYQWQKQDGGTGSFSNVSNGSGVSGATSATLSLSSLTNAADDGDVYRVVVSATDGATSVNSSGATLTVIDLSACAGDCYLEGSSPYYAQGLDVGTERQGPGGTVITLQWANEANVMTGQVFKVWKEKDGNRILNSSGFIANGWQKKLTRSGTSFSETDFTTESILAGRVCPTNVFLSHANMTATGRCLYYDTGFLGHGLTNDHQGVEAIDWMESWGAGATGQGAGSSYYEGNLQDCADRGMRLPTIYETTMNKPSSYLPDGDGLASDPIWAGSTNGVPSINDYYYFSWTASAFTGDTLSPSFWSWSGTNENYDYAGTPRNVVCVLPSHGVSSAPVITINTQPSNQTASSGSASFSVSGSVTQSATLSYRWQRQAGGTGGFVNLTNGSGVSGATTSTLSLSSLTYGTNNGDKYRVVVSATGGTDRVISSSATLTVNQCASDGWCADESTYYIGGISCPTLTSGGNGYCSGTGYYYVSGTETTLNSSGTGTWNSQTYTSGSLKSVITINTQPSNQTASSGSASFSVSASVTNSATLSYQWQKQEGGTGSFSNVSGGTSATLNLSSLTNAADDGDVYRVVVSATGGADDVNSSSATLTVAAEASGGAGLAACAGDCYLEGSSPGYAQSLTIGTERLGPSSSTLTLQYANGTSGFKLWKEKNGNRVLNASGFVANGWQQILTRAGTAFDGTLNSSSVIETIAGRACPPNVFLDYDNMTASQRCVYYDEGGSQQTLNAANPANGGPSEAVLSEDWISNWDALGTGRGISSSYYEGNIKTCADKGMRLPTAYETQIPEASAKAFTMGGPGEYLPTGDGINPVWAESAGVPVAAMSWTASAHNSGTDFFWVATADPTGTNWNWSAVARCVLPSHGLGATPVITINTQPSNQTDSSGSASFSVSASVTQSATLSYQWQKQEGGTGSFSNVSNGSGISGATTATLSLSNLTNASDNGDVYRVVVSATGGATSVNSSGATLTVGDNSGGSGGGGGFSPTCSDYVSWPGAVSVSFNLSKYNQDMGRASCTCANNISHMPSFVGNSVLYQVSATYCYFDSETGDTGGMDISIVASCTTQGYSYDVSVWAGYVPNSYGSCNVNYTAYGLVPASGSSFPDISGNINMNVSNQYITVTAQ